MGDSLALSQAAAVNDAEVIVFCGVHFMAENAAILAPEKKVILPALDAGCPLAEMADPEAVEAARAAAPRRDGRGLRQHLGGGQGGLRLLLHLFQCRAGGARRPHG